MNAVQVLEASSVSEPRIGESLWRPGNGACAGCGMSLGLQWLSRALGETTPTMVIPACCASVTPGSFPESAIGAPAAISTFAGSPAVATGISRIREINDEHEPTICWAGDGGTYDIGIATLSAAAERNENVLYICYDNEIYSNTGGQRSSATLRGTRTTTTPRGKPEKKKDIMAIMAAHRIPYAATVSLAHQDDLMRKMQVAIGASGFRFLLLLAPCPSGWKSSPADTVKLAGMAVDCGLFRLYEVFDGIRYRINLCPDGTSLEEYLSGQGRFKSESFKLEVLRSEIAENWSHLRSMEAAFPARPGEGLADTEFGGSNEMHL